MPKVNYAKLYTLRADGRYMGYWHDADGKRHAAYDKDPEALYRKIQEKEAPKELTFQQAADDWYVEHSRRLTYNAADVYVAPLRQLNELWGDIPVDKITPGMVQGVIDQMGKRAMPSARFRFA